MNARIIHAIAAGASALALHAPVVCAQSHGPADVAAAAKSGRIEAFIAAEAPATAITLAAPEAGLIEAVRKSNGGTRLKPLEIGIGRELPEGGPRLATSLQWKPVPAGRVARWEITSREAQALRIGLQSSASADVELRFAGSLQPQLVYGPFGAQDLVPGTTFWSPVLEGETAIVEVFVPGAHEAPAIALDRISHLFVSPAHPNVATLAKAAGACEVNFICRASTDSALAQAGRAVAKYTFTRASGNTTYCTGTLLNPADGSQAPYLYTAAHCMSTQASASTITTHWSYESTTCNGASQSPSYTQVAGGATLLHANAVSDVSFLRLNNPPPAVAALAGWDAAKLTPGSPVTAIHHPDGDLKKVSIGAIAGFADAPELAAGTFSRVQWNSTATGVTEGGSSGSGIFTGNASAGYRFRGGLLGGSSSCAATPVELYDVYSRFDLVFPLIAQYLSPANAPATGTNAIANPGFEGGSSGWTQNSSNPATTIITNDPATARGGGWYAWLGGAATLTDTLTQAVTIPNGAARLQFWYRIATSETASGEFDVFTVALVDPSNGDTLATIARFTNRDATSGWAQSPVIDVSDYVGRTVQLRLRATNDFSEPTSFRVDDLTLVGTQSVAVATSSTALWWNESESGWGINVNEQGNTAFATLFTYDSAGAPMWLVMPSGARRQGAATFSGTLYRTTGSPFNTSPFPPIGPSNITAIGHMTLDFNGGQANLGYTVGDTYVPKVIQKQVFGAAAASCQPVTGSRAGASNYQDLWWNPAESGWGINVTHQGNIVFATLFTYGAGGQGMWLVLPRGERQGDGSFLGDLFRTNGPAFNAQPWPGIGSARVGTMRLRFANGETGTLEYTVDGVGVTKAITRQVFATPAPLCSG